MREYRPGIERTKAASGRLWFWAEEPGLQCPVSGVSHFGRQCAYGGGDMCLPSSECQTLLKTLVNMEHCMGTFEMIAYKPYAAVY
eukprot:1141545-Pelagomonas_calceolata.AAC.2